MTEETAIERLVRELGPITIAESPFPENRGITSERLSRYPAVKMLWPRSKANTSGLSFSPTSQHQGILYTDDHDPRAVIEAYLDANPQILQRSGSWAVYQLLIARGYDDDLLEAAKAVLEERDPESWHRDARPD